MLVLAAVGTVACGGKQEGGGKVPLGGAPTAGAMAGPGAVEPVITAESQALLEMGNAAEAELRRLNPEPPPASPASPQSPAGAIKN